MAKLNIDGREYDTETLSEDAKAQITNVQVVDRKIVQLQQECLYSRLAEQAAERILNGQRRLDLCPIRGRQGAAERAERR